MDKLYQKHKFSLIWPDYDAGRAFEEMRHEDKERKENQAITERDINTRMIVQGMDLRTEGIEYVKARLADMLTDEKIIAYRQTVMKDFIKYPEIDLIAGTELVPLIAQLGKMEKTNLTHSDNVRKTVWRMEVLKVYVQSIDALSKIFCSDARTFESEGVLKLRDMISGIEEDPCFKELRDLLPKLSDDINKIQSITLGINLDSQLRPTEAVLLSISEKPLKRKGLLSNLFGTKNNEETYAGIGTWYSILKDGNNGSFDAAVMRELSTVMGETFHHLEESLKCYENIESNFLFELVPEIAFYLGGCSLYRKITQTGLPMCFPEALPIAKRHFEVSDTFDVSFALRIMSDTGITKLDNIVVTNNVNFGDNGGRIAILTGANQGGKTTFTRAIGLCQQMFQAGLPVAGTSGKISPCDFMWTHFPELEKNSVSEGRLGEECVRLEAILPHLTEYSFILMNESLSSTSHQECYTIATEICRYMRKIGSRAIFATHIHELAEDIPELNREEGLSDMVSLVAGVDETSTLEVMTEDGIKKFDSGTKRTYKITAMPPRGRSFALDIARNYGISFEQLLVSHDEIKKSVEENI